MLGFTRGRECRIRIKDKGVALRDAGNMLDATKALWYCGVGTCLVLAVAGIVFGFTMPEVSFWIGLYEGLAFWILFGMASGFLLVGLVKAEVCKKEAEFNSPDEDAVPPPSGKRRLGGSSTT